MVLENFETVNGFDREMVEEAINKLIAKGMDRDQAEAVVGVLVGFLREFYGKIDSVKEHADELHNEAMTGIDDAKKSANDAKAEASAAKQSADEAKAEASAAKDAVNQLRTDTNNGISDLKTKIAESETRQTRWALGLFIPVLVSIVLMLVKLVFFP